MRIATIATMVAIATTGVAAQNENAPRQQPAPVMSRALAIEAHAPPLMLDDAVRRTLESNPDLVAARQQIAPLRTKPAQARLLAAPMLEAQVWQWPINSLSPANTNMYMLMASQDLPGRGKRAAAVALADTEIRVAEEGVAARERETARRVAEAYWNLSIARRAIAIHLASVELLHELTDVAEAKYAAGRASQQDVLKATVEATRLHADLIELEQQAEQARVHLNALIARPLDAPVGPLQPFVETLVTASVEDLQALATAEQPELRVVRAEISRARAEQAVARTASTPDWSIGGGYMVQPKQTDAWLARVSMTWPRAPWSRRSIDLRAAETAAGLMSAEATAAATETRTRLAVTDAFVRVKAAEERAALMRTTLLPQARQVLEGSRTAFQSDRGDLMAVIDNERTLLDAQLSYERALAMWRQATADLERAVGAPLPTTMLRPASANEYQP